MFMMSRKRPSYMLGFQERETMSPTLEEELRERKARRLMYSGDITVDPMPSHHGAYTTEDNKRFSSPVCIGSRRDISEKIEEDIIKPYESEDRTTKRASCSPDISISTDAQEDISHVTEVEGMRVALEEVDLWRTFYRCGTEMIINRPGRRMFPSVSLSISGLNPSAPYKMQLEVVPADDRRYKYVNNKWTAVGKADQEIKNPPFLHPDSPSKGTFWMQTKIAFSKIKITNNKDSEEGNMLIHSMHKYMARLIVTRMRDPQEGANSCYVFPLPLTAFIAVTAYQSENITQMKIRNNPFAKAFRDNDFNNGMMYHQTESYVPRYLHRPTSPQASSGVEKIGYKNLENSNPELPLLGGLNPLMPSRSLYNYPPSVEITPHRSIFSPDSMFSYHGNAPVMPFMPPVIGHPNMTPLERNEATYRWLCACSQNISAQIQMYRRSRASTLFDHASTSASIDSQYRSPSNSPTNILNHHGPTSSENGIDLGKCSPRDPR